jgi:hypothetical protein
MRPLRAGAWPQRLGAAALVGERGHGDLPAIADRAEQVLVRHHRIGEEDLVERGVAVHLLQGLHFDRSLAHVDDETRQALVLGSIPVGPCEQEPPLGVMRAGRPHLLSVDAPGIAVALRARRGAGEVRARARLAEELTPGVLAGQDGAQEAALVRLAAMFEQGRARQQADADARDADGLDGVEFLVDDGAHRDRQAAPEPFARPVRHAPAGIGEDAAPRDEVLLGMPVGFQPGADRRAHTVLVHRAHDAASTTAR